ncbi:nicotinate-nucleotide adenylyltransferase [Arenimonas fontis]|uniref:Probable nicotinate-nucleotide adenylyltransferase n=1 Tax=Arenimonas fontis TaxID=2608255 RepID=A0A5B2ZGB5_9GAMM|nr:nicotinate-nucleotide adenylyltransferase [Arenimonas fontis]KAA2286274.1 nicotinate-nucleotide adenylyltransferase [Arenimonas fontis]
MKPVLAFGGTFDPVHVGHLAVARAVRDAFGAEVRMLPAADPPHRPAPGAGAEARAEMLALAIAGEPGLRLDRRELRRAGPSWTVDSLAELRAELGPQAPLAWVLGADAFRGLPTWHQWARLPELAHLVVVSRPDHDLDGLPEPLATVLSGRRANRPEALETRPAGLWYCLRIPPHPASASELRRRLAEGQPADDWLPAPVSAYIAAHGLYRTRSGGAGV